MKETSRRGSKELDDPKHTKEEKDKYYDRDINRHTERHNREPGELIEDRPALTSDDQESSAKKPKLFSLENVPDHGKDASKRMIIADEIQSSSSKQAQQFVGKVNTGQDYLKDSDIDAAKVAAMKASEFVNRNLIGTGYMSTDQKKKLLWGSKKTNTTKEVQCLLKHIQSGPLLGYILVLGSTRKVQAHGCERRSEGGAQARQPTCREAERTPAGLGEAVHCWIASKRWLHSWSRSLSIIYLVLYVYLLGKGI